MAAILIVYLSAVLFRPYHDSMELEERGPSPLPGKAAGKYAGDPGPEGGRQVQVVFK